MVAAPPARPAVLAAARAGIRVLDLAQIRKAKALLLVADVNAVPPAGVEGLDLHADGVPVGFQIVGRAFDEAGILAAGHAYQQATDWHLKRPPL